VAREEAVAGLSVLIVDDNETNRSVLGEKLTGWGARVARAGSAYEAILELDAAAGRGTPYDVALLDYMMPGVDGAQLARKIRAENRHDRTRLALMSSALEPSEEFLAAAGIDAFLAKPVLPTMMLDAVARLGGQLDVDDNSPVPHVDPVGDGVRGRILVVEDNPVNQLVAEGVLRRIGYSVVMSDNGASGLAAFAADPQGFDAILMDCQMPVMNGYDATHAIRAMQSIGPRIPIIAMTAGAAPEERQRCLTAGMDDFLLKPVDRALLEETLARWILGSTDHADGSVGAEPTPCPSAEVPAASAEVDVVLDKGRLAELLASGSADLALVLRIVDRFDDRVVDATREMALAMEAADPEEVRRVAHSLRGGAGNVGLVRLAGVCETLELRAVAGGLPEPGELLTLEAEASEGIAQLHDLAQELVVAAGAGELAEPSVSSV
jgi:CheY-like chemotaxis protein